MNWKLAIDTFGETYHFNTLHKDTLANDFYGNAQMYDTHGRNHRMMLCLRNIDTLRNQPEKDWNVLLAALPIYYIFPNIQLILGQEGPTLVRVYPDGDNPHQSFSKINFYLSPELTEIGMDEEGEKRYESAQERMQGFAEVIQMEDYVAAASAHQGMLSGAQEYLTFGRNEPALHHYHNTYREALGMPPLERISN
jgi:phenylpropionate dioxygenase-like ring-hydroxylating dioxygenase large terminal subunit